MKQILSKPKVVIPVAFVIALIIGALSYSHIGNPPVVTDVTLGSATSTITQDGTVGLSFNTSGRVAAVYASLGDKVTKGETLATLDASVAKGTVDQAKGALDLAKAQYGSLSIQYQNTKTQQDLLVQNGYNTLLSSGLQAFPVGVNDEAHNPTISGTYTCGKTGSYEISLYGSGTDSGYSFTVKGLEEGSGDVTYGTPQPLGSCGLLITFIKGFVPTSKWTVDIPNTKSSVYLANKDAYNLAVSTRDQVLSQLSANIGQNGDAGADIASASISAAQGAYNVALAAYQNSIITAPVDGTVSFIDASLKVGQSVTQGRPVISITPR